MTVRFLIPILVWCAGALVAAEGAESRARGGREPADRPRQVSASLDVPPHPCDVILGRPGRDAATISVLTDADASGWIAYGTEPGPPVHQTSRQKFPRGEPVEVRLTSLQPDTRYRYQIEFDGRDPVRGSFRTQRAVGSEFTFTVTADSHLDERVSAELYQRTLAAARAVAPDFHVDLGDTFMSEKHPGRESAMRQYLAQRHYLGQLGGVAPIFLALGNHDGEIPRGRGREPEALARWSLEQRTRYFPNPVPDGFYSGNPTPHAGGGLLQDYYAWEWGDALFVVLDPFWFSASSRDQRDNWIWSLGRDQYDWLARTLEASAARFTFVFIHHLVGGVDSQCRGGASAAPYYEWGGHNRDGTDGFATQRPGWTMPIHSLLRKHRVAVVFHGHDHLYAREELDGLIYQAVPQPGNPGGAQPPRNAAEYGYRTGTILGGSGYLRVQVGPKRSLVEYVATSVANDAQPGGRVLDRYELSPRLSEPRTRAH